MTPFEEDPSEIRLMIDRLSEHFPDTTRAHVAETVQEGFESLSGNPVRSYVPNLVEHEARTQLRREAHSSALHSH